MLLKIDIVSTTKKLSAPVNHKQKTNEVSTAFVENLWASCMYWERCFILPAAISVCNTMGGGGDQTLGQKIDIFPQFYFLSPFCSWKKRKKDWKQRLRLPSGISDAFFIYTFALQKKKKKE